MHMLLSMHNFMINKSYCCAFICQNLQQNCPCGCLEDIAAAPVLYAWKPIAVNVFSSRWCRALWQSSGNVCMVWGALYEQQKMHAYLQVHGTDEQCARVAQGQTLFYMPHCITAGFNNVLRANRSCLDRIAILGNSFLGYRISWKIARSQ